jgi:predicted transcriptional regulator of viral defense system
MALPRLLREFHAPGCFTLDEAEAVLGANRAREHVKYLRKRGYIRTVRRGLFALVPETTGVLPDRYLIACKAYASAYLSHHSALEVLGVAQTIFLDRLYVTVPTRVTPFTHDGTRVHPVVSAERYEGFLTTVKRGGQDLRVSGRELTLVQCLDRPALAGGLEELMRSVEGFSGLDWDRLEALLTQDEETYAKATLNAKVGFVVERFSDRWHPPGDLLERLADRTGKGVTYLGVDRGGGGRWTPRWRVIVPQWALEAW